MLFIYFIIENDKRVGKIKRQIKFPLKFFSNSVEESFKLKTGILYPSYLHIWKTGTVSKEPESMQKTLECGS